MPRQFNGQTLRAPVKVPDKIAMITETDLAPLGATGGVVGGIEGGIPGGLVGGSDGRALAWRLRRRRLLLPG